MALTGYGMLARRPLPFLRLAGPWMLAGMSLEALDPLWANYAFPIVGWLAWAVVSVAWCRFAPLNAACPIGGRPGRRELRFIVLSLPVVAMGVLALYVAIQSLDAAQVLFFPGFEDALDEPRFLIPVSEVGPLAYLVAVTRFQLMLPAISVNDRQMTFRSSLGLTRGSAIAIFTGSLIGSAPLLVPSLSWWIPADTPRGFSIIAANGLDVLASTVSAAVVAGFCAQLYRRQFERLAVAFE